MIDVDESLVRTNEKKSGFLEVVKRAEFSINVPITIVKGSTDGPTLSLIAGTHGCEYAGIEAALRLAKNITPSKLVGTLIIVPILNTTAFLSRTQYVCPLDNVNINRAFPGRLNGTASYIIAYNIFQKVILKSDYVIDLHGGDLMESELRFTIFYRTNDKKTDRKSEDLAKCFGSKYFLETSSEGPWIPAGTLLMAASKRGIPSAIAEAGGEGKVEKDDVDFLYAGVVNAMRHSGIVERGSIVKNKVIKCVKPTIIYAKKWGIFYSDIQVGDEVSKGQSLGEIRNLQGKPLQKVAADKKGIVVTKYTNPVVDPGSMLFWIIEILGSINLGGLGLGSEKESAR